MTKTNYVKDYVINKIISLDYKIGEIIPSENAMAIKLSVSRQIVRQAYDHLVGTGWIISKKGKGYYVNGLGHLAVLDFSSQIGATKTRVDVTEFDNDVMAYFENKIKNGFHYIKDYLDSNNKLLARTYCVVNKDIAFGISLDEIKTGLIKNLRWRGIDLNVFTRKIIVVTKGNELLNNTAKVLGYSLPYFMVLTELKSSDGTVVDTSLIITKSNKFDFVSVTKF